MDNLKKQLQSMSVSALRKEISKQNIKGYSKLKKADIINLMLINSDRFMYLVKKEKNEEENIEEKLKRAKKLLAKKKEELKKKTHKMPDGTVMTGKTHNKDSKPVKKSKPYSGERGGQKVDPDIGITEAEAEEITGMSSKKSKPKPKKEKIKELENKIKQIEKENPKLSTEQRSKILDLMTNIKRLKKGKSVLSKKDMEKKVEKRVASKKEEQKKAFEMDTPQFNKYKKDIETFIKTPNKINFNKIDIDLGLTKTKSGKPWNTLYDRLDDELKEKFDDALQVYEKPKPKKAEVKPPPSPEPKKQEMTKTEKEYEKVNKQYNKVKAEDKRYTRSANSKIDISVFSKKKEELNKQIVKLSNLRLNLLDKIKLEKEKQLAKDIKDFINFVKEVIKNPTEEKLDEIYDNELFDEIPEKLQDKLDTILPPTPVKKKKK